MDPGDPDEALLARVGEGDPAAVRALVARKLPRLLALAGRMLGDAAEAEDVAQETFVRAWKQARDWRPGVAKFDTWLHRVALNLCYDRLRRRREVATDNPPEQIDEGRRPIAACRRGTWACVWPPPCAPCPTVNARLSASVTIRTFNIEAAALMGVSVRPWRNLLSQGAPARSPVGYGGKLTS